MTEQAWIDWCGKQLADLSRKLFRQGYHPTRLERLLAVNDAFRRKHDAFLLDLQRVMDDMMHNPAGYHHYDAFSRIKMDYLTFTNINREHYLAEADAA